MLYVAICFAYFMYVYLRAFQQKNVIGNHKGLIIPTSYGMAYVDAFVMFSIAHYTESWHELILLAFCAGTGGWMGCLTAMTSHDKLQSFLNGKPKFKFKNSWKGD